MSRLRLLLALVLVALALAVVPGLSTPAAADPAISVSQDVPAQTLVGRETAVEVTFGNSGTDPAYNLAFSVRLPLGVSVSSSDEAPTRVITETDAGGDPTGTVVVWENIVDINPGSFFRFRYALAHELGSGDALWEVGETINAPVDAYVSASDAVRPTIQPQTSGAETTAVAADFDESGAGAGQTTLVPILLTKSEPSTEAELLRGVHDHQTTYSITAETGSDPSGVDVGLVEDWIPAGLEFLGCGTTDNSAGEEYPGSGPLNPGNAPALPLPCPDPVLVETVSTGIPAGLPGGVYTHVVWDIGATLAPNTTVGISYVAGIPQRENTLDWPGTPPTPASLEQGSNLDNNTGPLTTQVDDGTTYRNRVQVDSTFQGTDTTVTADEVVEAVDLSVHKFVDNPEIDQGGISAWQLYLETSEYVVDGGVTDLTLVDVTPDGTCPIGSVHPGCTVTQPDPVPAYTSSSYDAVTGETTLTWDLSTETLGRSETFIVGFSTEALATYADGNPVSANDSWVNTVDLAADVTTFEEDGPDTPAATNPVTDDSSQEQSGSAVSFAKDVARPADGETCGDGTGLTWQPDAVTGTGPGDRVCFRLTAVPPTSLDTIEVTLTDFLPPGFRYEVGSSTPGPDNEVPAANVVPASVSGTPATGQRLDWTLVPSTSVEPAQTAQVVFAAILDGGVTPDLVVSGDQAVNDARVSFQNTNGEVFVERDDAAVGLTEAHLDLTKGVAQVDPPAAPPTPYDPPVDTARDVVGGSVVTYEIEVTNDGTSDAVGVEVNDLLADNDQGVAGQDAVCGAIGDITPAGSCTGGVLTWTGLTVPAGGSITLTYTWTMPDPVPVGATWTNSAGVVEYRSATNTGPDYVYVPRDNIDTSREPDANTDRADDDAHLASPGISMTKTRTTSIDEPGNALADQATIGETISFTVESRQSASTTATDYELTDDLTDRGLALVPASVEIDETTAAPGAACVYAAPADVPGATLTVTGDTITITGAGGVTGAQDRCVVLRFDAVVQDVPDAGSEPLNVRPGVVRNEATLTYDIGAPDPVTISAGVDTQVVEPQIAVSKRALTTATVLPGTGVDYEVVVTNVAGSQVSVAHDVQVDDTWDPAWGSAVVANPDGGTTGSGSISWTLASLDPGESVTLRYTLRLADDLPAGQDLTNTVTAVTSSRAGSPPAERDDASPCSPAGCPGYEDDADATITVGGPSVTKTVLRPLHTLGDVVTYRLEALFPAHLDYGPDVVTLTDDLAGGETTYLETVTATCTGCSDAERAQYAAPEDNGTAGSATPRWDLAVLPAADVVRRVFLTFTARVEDDPANGAPPLTSTLTNTVTLDYGADTLTDTAEITLAEPDVTLVKRVATSVEPTPRTTTPGTPVTGEVGGTVTYELQVTNDGGWTAYDVVVSDEPDSTSSGGSCTGASRLGVVDVSAGAGWTVTDGTLGAADACLGFRVPTLLPGQSVTITYELSVPDDFPRADLVSGPELVNTAAVPEWFGLAAADRAGNPDVRDYPGAPVEDEGHVDLAGAALGDLVWLDVDGDGLGPDTGDATEPGLAGITVTITGPSGTLTRVTDADGRWLTDDGSVPPEWLAAGDYTVTIDQSTLPAGLVNTADPDGGADSSADTTLAENEVDLTQDFGYAGDQSVGDLVWLDLDGDGTGPDSGDAGEPGLAGIDLSVVWVGPDGDVDYGTVTTDAAGRYTATGLPAGRVEVTVDPATLPAGVAASYDLDGGLDDTAARVVPAGGDPTDVDFGYAGTAAVGDLVWLDRDGDGIADPAEPGLPDIDLVVTWEGQDGTLGTGDDVAFPTATTGAAGGYLVENLPAGDVEVAVQTGTLPAGLDQTYDADGTLDDTTVRTLAVGQVDRDADFGYTGQHTVGDLVWLDVEADGLGPDTGDADDPGIPGQPVAVRWSGGDGTFGTPDDVVLAVPSTDADGRWTVTGVPDGPVRATLQAGPAADLGVTADPDGTLDGTTERPVTADDLGFDFGLAGTGSVGDLVWLDVDEDGVDDAGEPPIPGVDVSVTWAGFDGDLGTADDVGYGTDTTGAAGLYLVGDLPPGDLRVDVDGATVPAGLAAGYDLDGGADETAVRPLDPGEDARDVDFAYHGTGRAGDLVWWDLDSDGAHQDREPGLPRVRVTLAWPGFDGVPGNDDDASLTARTGDAGDYLFTGLPAGDFTVTVDEATLPPGLAPTADPDGGADSRSAFTLPAGGSDLDQDFGYAGSLELGDLVWFDADRDADRDEGEEAVAGARLTVTAAGADGEVGTRDDVTIAARTRVAPAAAGRGGAPGPDDPSYLVTGLGTGLYVVALDPDSLGPDAPLNDLDGDDPARTLVELTRAELRADFGVFHNLEPQVSPESLTTSCGAEVLVDPAAGATDPNGDPLEVVPGSVRVPAGVDATVTDAGLRLATDRGSDYGASWQLADGRGGVATARLLVDVDGDCSDGTLPGTGSPVRPWWAGLGLLLLALGGGLVVASRRR